MYLDNYYYYFSKAFNDKFCDSIKEIAKNKTFDKGVVSKKKAEIKDPNHQFEIVIEGFKVNYESLGFSGGKQLNLHSFKFVEFLKDFDIFVNIEILNCSSLITLLCSSLGPRKF